MAGIAAEIISTGDLATDEFALERYFKQMGSGKLDRTYRNRLGESTSSELPQAVRRSG